MATNLIDYIKVYDGVLDQKICKNITDRFDLDIQHQEFIDRDKRPTFTELNITKRFKEKDSNWTEIQLNLQERFIDFVNLYIEEVDCGVDFPDKYAFEEYRIKKYNKIHDEFADHVDVGNYSSARRFLVCFLYLNDVPSGGYTEFPRLNYKVEPRCGRMLLFPSLWLYRHAGRPVMSGSKYIVGSYLHYL